MNLTYDVSLSNCYVCDVEFCEAAPEELDCTGYRLPTNAEWEYVSRAGTTNDFSMGGNGNGGSVADITSCHVSGGQFQETSRQNLTSYAWYCANTPSAEYAYGSTQTVATRSPNAWGFYDLQGNVSEWVYDTEIGFGNGNNEYFGYTPDSAVGLMRGGGYYDPPAQLSNTFVFEQMDRQGCSRSRRSTIGSTSGILMDDSISTQSSQSQTHRTWLTHLFSVIAMAIVIYWWLGGFTDGFIGHPYGDMPDHVWGNEWFAQE